MTNLVNIYIKILLTFLFLWRGYLLELLALAYGLHELLPRRGRALQWRT